MLTGTNLTYTKEYNLRIVHETIRRFGPLSRAEIARHTELSAQTVSNLVRKLMGFGLVVEEGRRREGRGAPSITLALNPGGAYAVGLDLNRDHLTGVLVDLAGNVCQRIFHSVDYPLPDDALALMVETVHQLAEQQGLKPDQIWGVGVGVPGPMRPAEHAPDTYVISPKAFPGWHDVPVAQLLQERLELPVFLENNATAAAVGERWYGVGQHLSTFFYIYFDSGLGGGLIIQGQPFEGHTGNAGEVGYLPMPAVTYGQDKHVGEHFSLPDLYRSLNDKGLNVHAPEDLAQLFDEEHPLLMEWLHVAADDLTQLVLTIEYLIDPQAIFFGGRLSTDILGELMKQVTERLPELRIEEKPTGPDYVVATAGVDAAALGVATLPIYEFFAPTHRILLKQSDDLSHPILNNARPNLVRETKG